MIITADGSTHNTVDDWEDTPLVPVRGSERIFAQSHDRFGSSRLKPLPIFAVAFLVSIAVLSFLKLEILSRESLLLMGPKGSNFHGRVGDKKTPLYEQVPRDDFGGLKEFSVIHSDRSLNLMSAPFQQVMRDLNMLLKYTYNAEKVAIIPGSGTFGMESVARQFALDKHVMVIRNGYFSYRWTQIFDMGGPNHQIPKSHTVLKAQPLSTKNSTMPTKDIMSSNNSTLIDHSDNKEGVHQQFMPHPIEQVVARIQQEGPSVVFAPHVETSTGMILPDEYIRKLSNAVHDVENANGSGGLLVLDCIASGTMWIDMKELGVDVLISAPQKDWTSYPCAALVMLSERALLAMKRNADGPQQQQEENSFSLSLTQWLRVMDAYEDGGYAYHTTLPTDALRVFQEVSVEMMEFGLLRLERAQIELGSKLRNLFQTKWGLTSVAAPGYEAPGVLVYYSPQNYDLMENPGLIVDRFKHQGLQIAMGVPWMIGEPDGIKSFRIGLFGLDKLANTQQTIDTFVQAMDRVLL